MNYRTAREILSEAIEQLDEAKTRGSKVEPIAGNPAPYGYHVKVSPSGRKRYIPKTQKDFDSERKKFYAKHPGGEKAYWAEIERRQRKANHANRGEIAESFEQLDEASNLRRQRSRMSHREASLIRRAGGSQEEVRDALSGKRTPTAKSGLGLLAKAYKSAGKNRSKKDPYFPYGKAETRRMSKYMSEATMNSMGLFMDKKSKPAAKKPAKVNKAQKFTKVKKPRKNFQGLHSKYWETDGRPV